MSKITIGIDPGKSGGICAYDGKKLNMFMHSLVTVGQVYLNLEQTMECG